MMDITMVGIDYSKASIGERELFSFTRHQAEKAMRQWKKERGITGCLILSTCNRTELWVTGERTGKELREMLCCAKGLEPKAYEDWFVVRTGQEAVTHLLQLICGLKSMIRGEDQILAQVREALEWSRGCNAADTTIEKLFQTAISAGKRVKTEIKFNQVNPSAAQNGLLLVEDVFGTAKELPCLVIGNGQMGRLAAEAFMKAGAQVSMTLRKRYHGNREEQSTTMPGCRMIEYDDRLSEIEKYKVVISATRSPHFTVKAGDLGEKEFDNCLWIDMAVPRDLEPAVGEIGGIRLLDMDELGTYPVGDEKAHQEAAALLQEYEKELEQWYSFRRHVDLVKNISGLVKEDIMVRASKSIDDENVQMSVETAAQKTIEKLLFGLKETLPQEEWQSCLAALEQSARRDTIKS